MSRNPKPSKKAIEGIIYELYRESTKKDDKERVCYYIMSIGLEDEPWVVGDRLKSLDYLKKAGVIKSYVRLNYADSDLEKRYKEMMEHGIELVVCKFVPEEIISYLKRLWNEKFEASKELAEKIITLKDCIQLYFKDSNFQTKQLELEKQYKSLCQRIKRLIFLIDTDIHPYSEFFSEYKNPFASLFSASTEMDKKKLLSHDVIKGLDVYYANALGMMQLFGIDRQEVKFRLDRKSKYPRIIAPLVPKGTKWEQITMKFLNGHEVLIKTKDVTISSDYEALGFADTKSRLRLPNLQWDFLVGLSRVRGELTWKNNHVLRPNLQNSAVKRKQLLADTLKIAFGISEDPFYDYKKEKAYKIKMVLIPEEEDAPEEDEIEDYFKEKAPTFNKLD